MLCRFFNSVFFFLYGIRKDVRVFMMFYGRFNFLKMIYFEGFKLKVRFNLDERSIVLILKKVFKIGEDFREFMKEVEVFLGVYVSNMMFEDVVRRVMKDLMFYYFVEDGKLIIEIEFF